MSPTCLQRLERLPIVGRFLFERRVRGALRYVVSHHEGQVELAIFGHRRGASIVLSDAEASQMAVFLLVGPKDRDQLDDPIAIGREVRALARLRNEQLRLQHGDLAVSDDPVQHSAAAPVIRDN